TDNEFIARSRDCTKISPLHTTMHNEIMEKNNPDFSEDTLTFFKGLRTYSIDYSKIIMLEVFSDIVHDNPQVTIFDIQSNTLYNSERLEKLSQTNTCNISHIALSRSGSQYAQLQLVDGAPEETVKWQQWLIIQNIFSDKIQKFLIPGYYDKFTSIGFNKQGTKIIVHAKENGMWQDAIPATEQPETWYHIIP